MSILLDNSEITLVDKVDFSSLCTQLSAEYDSNGRDEPFYVCDLGDVIAKHRLWIESFPRITPFYALKCNPDPTILKLMVGLGLSFDCASREEIRMVMDEGVSNSRIIYANPCKPSSHISYAKSMGVKYMTCDCVSEVEKIYKLYPEASLVIRMFVETSKARCPLGLKFGASMNEIVRILEKAQELDIDVSGVSFHVGSGCFDASVYGFAISEAKKVFNLASKYGFFMNILDIGGGFPGDLTHEDNYNLFLDVRNVINDSLEKFFPRDMLGDDKLFIIGEPGRFYVSSAFQLCCTVTSVKTNEIVASNGPEPQLNYYLNDGVYGSFNCVIFDHYTPSSYLLPTSGTDHNRSESFPTVLWGPTCDSMDKICEVSMPRLSIGDQIVFSDMGAYTMAAGCTFNGFPRPSIHYFTSTGTVEILAEALKIDLCHDQSNLSSSTSDIWNEDSVCGDDLHDELQKIIGDAIIFHQMSNSQEFDTLSVQDEPCLSVSPMV